jgi:hypothetical protein
MPHDKGKAAARKRMAETGEPYTAARRAVATEHQDPEGQTADGPAAEGQVPPAGPGYALAMSGEIHDWLCELRVSGPPAAMRVIRALVMLMHTGAGLGDPLVASVADSWPWALMRALDRTYQERLDQLAALRRGEAAAVTLIKDIQEQIAAPETPETLETLETREQIAEACQLLPGVIEARDQLSQAIKRLQPRAEAWRARKEVLKAGYVAASSGRRAREAIAALDLATGEGDRQDDGDSQAISGAADARLAELTAQMEQALGLQAGPAGLLELRPGAPLRGDTRIVFAVEPPGTALLIAVLDGLDAVEDQFPEAVMASADKLRQVRAGQAPEAAAHTYADARSFLVEFYF